MSLLDDVTTRGDQVRGRLYEFVQRHKYDSDTKNAVSVAYVAIALEHHKAIWILSKLGLNGSAFALLRAVFEAYCREQRVIWMRINIEVRRAGQPQVGC